MKAMLPSYDYDLRTPSLANRYAEAACAVDRKLGLR
jgi:hypothetical protein